METTQKNKQDTILEEIFNKLSNFFNGKFHLGIHGITYSEKHGKMVEWSHPVAWFSQEDESRDARLSDMSFCLKQNRQNRDVYIRPSFDVEDHFILFDDISAEKSVRWSKRPGTLIINTSPGKFQAWRKLDRAMSYDEKMEYIKMEQADVEATATHRWFRCPGFKNCKAKYEPNFPLVRINNITEGVASLNKLETVKPIITREYVVSKAKNINITRERYHTGNESVTDFRYTLALLRFGADDAEITARLMSERTNWDNKSEQGELRERYITRTINNAKSKFNA